VEKRWLSPEDLLVRWQAKPFEVVDAIKKGLPLYNVMTGECYNDTETLGKICLKLQQILPQQNSAWEYDLFNSDPWEAVEVGFKLSEVVAYEKLCRQLNYAEKPFISRFDLWSSVSINCPGKCLADCQFIFYRTQSNSSNTGPHGRTGHDLPFVLPLLNLKRNRQGKLAAGVRNACDLQAASHCDCTLTQTQQADTDIGVGSIQN